MKRRILALALSLILTTLSIAPMALAEEAISAVPVAEPLEEFLPEEVPEEPAEPEILPEPEVPAEPEVLPEPEEPAESEVLPEPAESEVLPEPEDPVEAEEPVAPPIFEEVPAEAEVPEEPEPTEHPLTIETEVETSDARALGSENVQYAGVTYLSEAAFNGLGDGAQDAYIQQVDEITNMLDGALPLEDVVFATDGKGNLYSNITFPLLSFDEEGNLVPEDVEPEAVEAEFAEESEPVEAAAEAEAPEAEGEVPVSPEATEGEAQAEPIAENMELFESLDVPAETFDASDVQVDLPAIASVDASGNETISGGFQQYDTLFWNNKNYFKNQLSSTEKTYYNNAYNAIVKNGRTKFTTTTYSYSPTDAANAVAALMNTYPAKFEIIRGGGSWRMQTLYWSSGRYEVTFSLIKNPYYSSSYETQAKAKVKQLVTTAYNYAKSKDSRNPTYYMIEYFDQWLCEHNYYNLMGTSDAGYTNTQLFYYCHTSYGTLLKGYGVCESYALAMSRLLDAAGIPNLYVSGIGYTSSGSGGHAWNYVQMHNGTYYLLDSTWDDPVLNEYSGSYDYSQRTYLLCGDDGCHVPDGRLAGDYIKYSGGTKYYLQTFKFPSISKTKYSVPYSEPINLNKTVLYLTKGKSSTLKLTSTYYSKYKQTWSSSNNAVAKVSSKGKVTAVAPGKATISLTVAGSRTVSCTVYVYQFTSLRFSNNKTSATSTLYHTGTLSDQVYSISVKQKNRTLSADSIRSGKGLKAPTVSRSNKSVAKATATLSGDTITLRVTPLREGNVTIKVSFAGKSATLKFRVRRKLDSSWFDLSYTSRTYTGASFKPTVKKTIWAPSDLKKSKNYTVSYSKNKNVGTATVTIKAIGTKYGSSVKKTFTINPADITNASVSKPKSKVYNSKSRPATLTVKLGKKTLKAGTDFDVYYNGSTAKPKAAGTYSVTVRGKGNYTGWCSTTRSYTITQLSLSNLKLSAKSSVSYNGSSVTPTRLNLTLKYGTIVIPSSDYSVSYFGVDNDYRSSSAPYQRGKYQVLITPKRPGNLVAGKEGRLSELHRTFKIT